MKHKEQPAGHHLFEDRSGTKATISPSSNFAGTAAVDTDPEGTADVFYVHAHELAEVVAAMYEAAGQPVPVLPVIHDQAEVESLATLLHFARENISHGFGEHDVKVARVLLAHGVRLPEAR